MPPVLARGLKHFINDIKSSKNREQETRRVTFELVKIQAKFNHARGTAKHAISTYDLKKYACKLVYIRVLGYIIDFGLREALLLMASTDLGEKATGYALANLLADPVSKEDALEIFATVRNDLRMPSRGSNVIWRFEVASLALGLVANCGFSFRCFWPYVSRISEEIWFLVCYILIIRFTIVRCRLQWMVYPNLWFVRHCSVCCGCFMSEQ